MRETFVLEDILNALISLEEYGNTLYTDLSDHAEDLETVKLFKALALQELNHKKLYESFKRSLNTVSEIEDDYLEYVKVMINSNIHLTTQEIKAYDFADALKLGIQLEKDTILFLNELKDVISDQHHDIDKLINEEKKHLKILLNLKK